MAAVQRAFGACFAALLAGLAVWAANVPAVGDEPSSPPPAVWEDAELTDVFFLDADQGWAVGDRGVILATDDGGRNWRPQTSPATCRLESVFFLDENIGWVVGGRPHAYTHRSSGVVLRTRDGGRHWEQASAPTLPALKRVKFFDAKRGCAIGASSAMYPAGVFLSDDGGHTWRSLPPRTSACWATGDFPDPDHGVVAGRDGATALLQRGDLRPLPPVRIGMRRARCVRMADPHNGWLVGDGGLVVRTGDGGATWQAPPGPLPEGVASQFDFQTIALQEGHCWIAGSPGARILHSADGGTTWELLPTGQSLPIRAMAFINPDRGWAVGALGTILATRDGGRTWRRQRSSGERAAVVGFFGEPTRAPWELFALLSGEEGYLGVVEILDRRDVEAPRSVETSEEERTQQAAVAVGASTAETAWAFPLRQAGLSLSAEAITEGWDRHGGGGAAARLESLVVSKIRQWRPDVIITEAASPQGQRPLSHLINQIVLSAAARAAEPTACPDQIRLAGLAPWKVTKVFSTRDGQHGTTVNITTAQLAPRLGRSLADQATRGRGLIARQYEASPDHIALQLLVNRLPGALGRKSVFHGIALAPGGEARRRLAEPNATTIKALSRAAQKSRTVQHLLAGAAADPQRSAGWLAQAADLTQGLNADNAAEVLYCLGRCYEQTKQPDLAADALALLVEQHPNHPLTESAALWLVQYYSSGEAAWRARGETHGDSRRLEAARPDPLTGTMQALWRQEILAPRFEQPAGAVRRAAAAANAGDMTPAERAGRAAAIGKWIQRTQPALSAEPAIGFPLAAALRAQGSPRDAERFYERLSAGGRDDAWRARAEDQLWLLHRRNRPSGKSAGCQPARDKPRLDGRLDDSVWRAAAPLELKSALRDDATWPATVLLAHDAQFLYLAISCRKPPGKAYSAAEGVRSRDPDLSGRDRVDLLLDVNRDYASYYRLTVDHRGWTGEACMGDTSWNPEWYVAAADQPDQWTAEAAIPLIELGPRPPAARDAWAIGVQRTVPGVGFQSWTTPAATDVRPEGFGLLTFE